ncbi:putative mariner transposase [Trichonephila clavipes]|nr:putative mariner transposase [Trichonephila clavipes]
MTSPSPNFHNTPTEGRLNYDRFNVLHPSTRRVFNSTKLKLISLRPRDLYFDHKATAASTRTKNNMYRSTFVRHGFLLSPLFFLCVLRKASRIDFLESIENDPYFLEHVITGDESWVFEYDPETKRQSMNWHTSTSPRPKKARMSKSKIKNMLIRFVCFFDSQGIVQKEFVPQGQAVNQHFYREVLERLRKRVMRVRPNIKNSWVLHHDDAPCRTEISMNRFLASKNIPVASQPPYSPNLSPCDFFLFPKLKNPLKGHHFGTLENIQTVVTDQLKAIPISEFYQCYEEWKKRLQCCVWLQKKVTLKETMLNCKFTGINK